MLRALATEMRNEQVDLALHQGCSNRHIQIGDRNIAVPFRYLVFENEMIPKRVPDQAGDLAMVLVRIILSMGENDIGIGTSLERLEPEFDLIALLGKESIPEIHDFDCTICRARQKIVRGGPRFLAALIDAAEHAPMNVEANPLAEPA